MRGTEVRVVQYRRPLHHARVDPTSAKIVLTVPHLLSNHTRHG
jgi:hypothetical protein